MGRPAREQTRDEFAYWSATPKRLRVSLDLPKTELEFGQVKEVDPRTLRRWKNDDSFKKLVAEYRKQIVDAQPESTVTKRVVASDDPAMDPELSVDERHYLAVKDTLIRMAQDGNQGAVDLYLKHYGKSFVEAEQQGFVDYADLDDADLIQETLRFIGVERVSSWLASQAE
jgi:hypothetical protein